MQTLLPPNLQDSPDTRLILRTQCLFVGGNPNALLRVPPLHISDLAEVIIYLKNPFKMSIIFVILVLQLAYLNRGVISWLPQAPHSLLRPITGYLHFINIDGI